MKDNGIFRAEQRVKEMSRMAQQYVRQGNNYLNNNVRQQVQPRFEPVQKPVPSTERKTESTCQRQEVPQRSFTIDNEKLLIIIIMYLLIKENVDINLVAALAYLLM